MILTQLISITMALIPTIFTGIIGIFQISKNNIKNGNHQQVLNGGLFSNNANIQQSVPQPRPGFSSVESALVLINCACIIYWFISLICITICSLKYVKKTRFYHPIKLFIYYIINLIVSMIYDVASLTLLINFLVKEFFIAGSLLAVWWIVTVMFQLAIFYPTYIKHIFINGGKSIRIFWNDLDNENDLESASNSYSLNESKIEHIVL